MTSCAEWTGVLLSTLLKETGGHVAAFHSPASCHHHQRDTQALGRRRTLSFDFLFAVVEHKVYRLVLRPAGQAADRPPVARDLALAVSID
jgi:hypothetical protein